MTEHQVTRRRDHGAIEANGERRAQALTEREPPHAFHLDAMRGAAQFQGVAPQMKGRRIEAHVPAQLEFAKARIEGHVVRVRLEGRDVCGGRVGCEAAECRERRKQRARAATPDPHRAQTYHLQRRCGQEISRAQLP